MNPLKNQLYPILDLEYCETFGIDIYHLLRTWESFPGSISFFQLRAKSIDDHGYKIIYHSLKNYSTLKIIINDRWKIALSEKSFGIHLGKEDYEILDGESKSQLKDYPNIKGTSSHSLEDVLNLESFWNYTGIGPIFPTSSKETSYEPLGIQKLIEISQKTSIPLVAIGGIAMENISEILKIKNVIPASISLFSKSGSFSQIVKKWSENMA